MPFQQPAWLEPSRTLPDLPACLVMQAIDAGTGLLYLHSRNIVHRDGMPLGVAMPKQAALVAVHVPGCVWAAGVCGYLMHSGSPFAVKSPNYLVDQNFGIKVSDFNLSRLLGDTGPSLLSAGGVSNPVWLVSMQGCIRAAWWGDAPAVQARLERNGQPATNHVCIAGSRADERRPCHPLQRRVSRRGLGCPAEVVQLQLRVEFGYRR